MYYDENTKFKLLNKLYASKCCQLAKAKLSSNILMYQVLKAEAEALRIELGLVSH